MYSIAMSWIIYTHNLNTINLYLIVMAYVIYMHTQYKHNQSNNSVVKSVDI